MTLLVQNGTCGYSAAHPVLQNINFSVEAGEVLCILMAPVNRRFSNQCYG